MSRRPQVHLALDRDEALALLEMIHTSRVEPAGAKPHTAAAIVRRDQRDSDRLSFGGFLRAGTTATAKLADALYPNAVDTLDERD